MDTENTVHLDVFSTPQQVANSSTYTVHYEKSVRRMTANSVDIVWLYVKKTYLKTGRSVEIRNSADTLLMSFTH